MADLPLLGVYVHCVVGTMPTSLTALPYVLMQPVQHLRASWNNMAAQGDQLDADMQTAHSLR